MEFQTRGRIPLGIPHVCTWGRGPPVCWAVLMRVRCFTWTPESFSFVWPHCLSSFRFGSPVPHSGCSRAGSRTPPNTAQPWGCPPRLSSAAKAPPVALQDPGAPSHGYVLKCLYSQTSFAATKPETSIPRGSLQAFRVLSLGLDCIVTPEFCFHDLPPSLVSSGSPVT